MEAPLVTSHRGPIDRATAEDLVSLATDVGSAPMQVGAVLLLDTGLGFDLERATAAVAERIRSVPRLRQRLVPTPVGCGRPIWIDDTDFDIGSHVSIIDCPVPGDEAALLNVAAGVICTRLPADRPLWRMALVTGLAGERTALIVAFHHVLADGIGGLAVLVNLVDGVPADPVDGFPRPAPTNLQLLRDAVRSRWAALATLPASVRRARAAIVQLRPAASAHPARSSLNRPTGALRQFGVARADLEEVRRVAHASRDGQRRRPDRSCGGPPYVASRPW